MERASSPSVLEKAVVPSIFDEVEPEEECGIWYDHFDCTVRASTVCLSLIAAGQTPSEAL